MKQTKGFKINLKSKHLCLLLLVLCSLIGFQSIGIAQNDNQLIRESIAIDANKAAAAIEASRNEESVQNEGDAKLFFFAPVCPPLAIVDPYIGGKIYEDIGQDGSLTAGIDRPIAGVTVTFYSASGTLIGSTMSSTDGDYLFESPMMVSGEMYRVEFSTFPAGFESSIMGTDNNSSVQFIQAESCNVNFGLTDPDLYCDEGLSHKNLISFKAKIRSSKLS